MRHIHFLGDGYVCKNPLSPTIQFSFEIPSIARTTAITTQYWYCLCLETNILVLQKLGWSPNLEKMMNSDAPVGKQLECLVMRTHSQIVSGLRHFLPFRPLIKKAFNQYIVVNSCVFLTQILVLHRPTQFKRGRDLLDLQIRK